RIALYDVSGKEVSVVYAGSLSNGVTEYSLPVSELPSGSYTVRVEVKGQPAVVKTVVIQK
ncbi:MAG: T9SS type A sorting domain-containing protein, partial [Chlorobi bacterium]|nr:T9SS type A sorting domain-containing protein [Chlorobiota bacterium]MBL7989770.1 T9SS type A sorting domain-containing protein [Chlorobiota bacterium]